MGVCSCIWLYVCQWVVILSHSLQSRRNEWDCTLASIRDRPLVEAVFFFFCFSLPFEMLDWAAAILTHLNQWTTVTSEETRQQCEWFRRMKMAWLCRLTGFCSAKTPPPPLAFYFSPHCQWVLCCTLKSHYHHPAVFPDEIHNIAVIMFSVVRVNIRRFSWDVWRRAEMGKAWGLGVDLFWAWTGECGSSLACCYDVFVVLDLM